VLPDNPNGAPVVFAWHWLGGTADQILDWVGFEDLADEGAIVVAPESSGSPYEWRWDEPSDSNADAQLFEDTLACLYEQWDIDLDRVHTTGMSAGGLWSTWLIMFRSEWLASGAPLSGGFYAQWYTSPEETIPVMLVWGGPTDTYNGYSFDVSSQDFSGQLRDDDHFVVECEHSGGHIIPTGAVDFVWRFFEDHPRGEDEEPWADGLPSALPSYCVIP
jgi:dienelactone hydrolase